MSKRWTGSHSEGSHSQAGRFVTNRRLGTPNTSLVLHVAGHVSTIDWGHQRAIRRRSSGHLNLTPWLTNNDGHWRSSLVSDVEWGLGWSV